ncbi:MAG: hypothetical protein LBM23_02715 [Propionibacteriaceae bacterium]|nr:hypothetical protein [Propionibacteriaceae bacterium]
MFSLDGSADHGADETSESAVVKGKRRDDENDSKAGDGVEADSGLGELGVTGVISLRGRDGLMIGSL